MKTHTPRCPRCGLGQLVFDPITKTMICNNCGFKTGADIDEKGKIRNKDVEKDNLRLGKRFELGSFI
jgi:ribosomal protein L37E